MISYSQNFEDVILWRALKHVKSGCYIDIGAWDPVVDSVSQAFYLEGWRGVHVEPVPFYAKRLRDARPDEIVVEAAVGNSGKPTSLLVFDGTGLTTASHEFADFHRKSGFSSSTIEVSTRTLASIFSQVGGRDIHWLKIDVEGMEEAVIESWANNPTRPWVVIVESTIPSTRIESSSGKKELIGLGYKFVYFDGLNRFYVHQSHPELFTFFGLGPNIFDNFVRFEQQEAQRQATELNKQLTAKEKALQETHKAREEAQAKATELNKQLAAKEKALQETHKAREEAQGQGGELNKQLAAKEKALQETHKAREEAQGQAGELNKQLTAKGKALKEMQKANENTENKLDEKTRLFDTFYSKLDKDLSVWKDDLSENTKLLKMILLIANPVFYFAARVILRPIYLKRLMLSLPEISITEKKQDTRINLSDKRPDSVGDGPTLRLRQDLEAKELVIQNLLLEKQAWRVAGFLFWPLQRLVQYLIKKKKEITGTRLGKLRQHPPESFVFHIRSTPKMQGLIPTVSVVTPAYNQADFLPQTIDSVLGQGYPGLQYVVQDGGSKDGSPELIRSHESRLHAWESIADRGQAHALNLGFRKTSGEIMGWLNADDLHTPNTLWTVARFFQRNPQVDVVYGHRVIINEKNHKIGIWVMPDHCERILSWADYIPQETLFWRRGIWEKAGGMMNESFHFALDWDLILRFRRAGARFFRIPELLGCFRVHDKQKTSQLLDSRGKEEMDLLRQQVHGIIPTEEEIWHQIKGYLKESVGSHLGWKMSQLWKRVVLMEKKQTLFP